MSQYTKILLTGLWNHYDGDEVKLISGSPAREVLYDYVILPNTNKSNDSQPDFFLYLQINPKKKSSAKKKAEKKKQQELKIEDEIIEKVKL